MLQGLPKAWDASTKACSFKPQANLMAFFAPKAGGAKRPAEAGDAQGGGKGDAAGSSSKRPSS